MLARGGDLFVARLVGSRDPLAQVIEFRGVLRLSGDSEQQSPGVSQFFDRADMGLCECDIGGKIVVVDDDELVINSTGHAHAQESHDGHHDQQPDRDAEYLETNGNAHSRIIQSTQPAPRHHAGRPQTPNYTLRHTIGT